MGDKTVDFMVQNKLGSGDSPPFLGLVPLKDSYYERALTSTRKFLNGDNKRISRLFRNFPYSSAWLIARTLNDDYGDNDHAVYKHIEKALQISLLGQGKARLALYEEFSRVCLKLGLSVSRTNRYVDTYLSQAGVSPSLVHHVIDAFLRQDRAFGPPPTENTALLNRWESGALEFMPPSVVTPGRSLDTDETGYHARLYARAKPGVDFVSEIPFEITFAKLLEEARKAGPSSAQRGAVKPPKPKLLWNNGLILRIPRLEGKLQLWLDGGSRMLRFRGGDEWVIPQPWPVRIKWKTGEHVGDISLLESPGSFAVFDLVTSHLVKECLAIENIIDIDAAKIVILARSAFSISEDDAINTQSGSWVAYARLGPTPIKVEIAGKTVQLKARSRRRISLETGAIARGSRGYLLQPNAEFQIETGRVQEEKRWLRITIGDQVIGREIEFSEEGVGRFCLSKAIESNPEIQNLPPAKLRLELMAPDVRDVSQKSGTAGLSYSGWIWPGLVDHINGRVYKSLVKPENLSLERCRHIRLNNSGDICLDPSGGYVFATLTFEINGEPISFQVPWPDVSVVRIREDGSSTYIPYGSKLIVGDEDRFDTIVVSCPDTEAELFVRGSHEKNPFYRGMRRSLALRDLSGPAKNDQVLLRKSGGSDLLLFEVVSTVCPEHFTIRDTSKGRSIVFRLPKMVDAVQLELVDELGGVTTEELALGFRPVTTRCPAWLNGATGDNDANLIALDVDFGLYGGRFCLAKILIRELGQETWKPLRAARGDLYAFLLKGTVSDDCTLPAPSDLALRFRTFSRWLSECYAEPVWESIGCELSRKWKFLARLLFGQPGGKSELLSNALIAPSEEASVSWIPMIHPVQILPELYSAKSHDFAPLSVSENPGDCELAFLAKISSPPLREQYRKGNFHQVLYLAFDNLAEAEKTGEVLQGFDVKEYYSFLDDPSVDSDPVAGWFWNTKPLLGPDHWRMAHLRFVERIEEHGLFGDVADDGGDNAAREERLQRFMKECWDFSDTRPPVPKRGITEEEFHRVDLWAFASLSEFARASRFGGVPKFVEKLSTKLDESPRLILGDISLLIRLAPEAFAFFMLIWQIAKERT